MNPETLQPDVSRTGFQVGFESFGDATDYDRLELDGEIPSWLSGTLLRSSVSLFEVGSTRMRHWFDGLAMLHNFTFDHGQVSYRSRMLESRAYREAQRAGHATLPEFGTDPCRSIFKRVQVTFHPELTDNGAVTVNRLGDEFLAMTETPMPVQFDPRTLETLDIDHRAKAPGDIATAHAHIDPGSGGMLNYALKIGPKSSYRFYTVGATGGATVVAKAPAKPPRYVHSFGVTDDHIVLLAGPLALDLGKLIGSSLAKRSFLECFEWKPELGTEILVFDRRSGELLREFTADAMFCFHHVNAFERDGRLVVDVCAFDDAAIVYELYLDNLRDGEPRLPKATLRRLTLDLENGGLSAERLWDGYFELPRINYRANNGRQYQFAYGVSAAPGVDNPEWFEALAKVDVQSGEAKIWHEPGLYPSEPVFIAAPGAAAEDEGVVLSIGVDAAARRSELTVFDAASFEPVARAAVPHVIPFGFHAYHYNLG